MILGRVLKSDCWSGSCWHPDPLFGLFGQVEWPERKMQRNFRKGSTRSEVFDLGHHGRVQVLFVVALSTKGLK